jgi:hypothetical protein
MLEQKKIAAESVQTAGATSIRFDNKSATNNRTTPVRAVNCLFVALAFTEKMSYTKLDSTLDETRFRRRPAVDDVEFTVRYRFVLLYFLDFFSRDSILILTCMSLFPAFLK